MASNSVNLEILTETKKALSDLSSFKNSASKTFKAFGAAAVAAGAAVAGAFAFRETIAAASRQEDAVNSVAVAMGRLGEFSNEALIDMQNFASTLQDVTGVGDEATLEMISLAKSFGATNNQAKLMTQAAVELAAATGKSTDEAIRQVSKTLGGFAGELGEVNPQIKALTAEQLKAGDAAKILLDTYGGTAASKLNTFSGAVAATEGRFGDLLETIGDLIIKNPVIIKLIKALGNSFKSLGNFFSTNRDTIIDFINKGILGLAKAIPITIRAFKPLIKAVETLNSVMLFAGQGAVEFLKVFAGFDFVQETIGDISRGFDIMFEKVIEGVEFFLKSGFGRFALERFGVNVEKVTASISDLRQGIKDTINDPTQYTGKALEKFLGKTSSAIEKLQLENENFFTGVRDGAEETAKSIEKFNKELEKSAKIRVSGPTIENIENAAQEVETNIKVLTKDDIAKAGSTFVAAVQKGGKDGAKILAITAATGIASALGAGPFAQTIGDVVNLLMTDGAAQLIKDVVNNIPQIVETLAENIPLVAVALAEATGDPSFAIRIAAAFAKGMSAGIVQAFDESVPKIKEKLGAVFAFVTQGMQAALDFPGAAHRFGIAMKEAFVDIREDFKKQWVKIRDAIFEPFEQIAEMFRYLAEVIKSIIPTGSVGGGGGGGFVGQVFRGEAFATGGLVPSGFPNDTFPARLTSGELVIPPGDTARLSKFLDNQQQASDGGENKVLLEDIRILLAQLVNIGKQEITVNATADIDGDAFADIILELNRRNARLA